MMKTVGKTMRTLHQASSDLRESTGIDELLRDDFSDVPLARRPAPLPAQHSIARAAEPPGVTPTVAAAAAAATSASVPSLPSDGPVPDGVATPAPAAEASLEAEHSSVEGPLPSDAPVTAPGTKRAADLEKRRQS